jgi:hypothetical protein
MTASHSNYQLVSDEVLFDCSVSFADKDMSIQLVLNSDTIMSSFRLTEITYASSLDCHILN